MLIPVQPNGHRAPLFFVHGLHGVMPVGRQLGHILGPEQPFYSIQANGIDGTCPPADDFTQIVRAYMTDIESVARDKQVRVAGMCGGALIAIELARALNDRHCGPVVLADPPVIQPRLSERPFDSGQNEIRKQLYKHARSTLLDHAADPQSDLPFNPSNPEQLHSATVTAVATMVAVGRHAPTPFSGPAEVIISAERASGFFHPQMAWGKLLTGRRRAHVLPWSHRDLFKDGLREVGLLLNFVLEVSSDPADTLELSASPRSHASKSDPPWSIHVA